MEINKLIGKRILFSRKMGWRNRSRTIPTEAKVIEASSNEQYIKLEFITQGPKVMYGTYNRWEEVSNIEIIDILDDNKK